MARAKPRMLFKVIERYIPVDELSMSLDDLIVWIQNKKSHYEPFGWTDLHLLEELGHDHSNYQLWGHRLETEDELDKRLAKAKKERKRKAEQKAAKEEKEKKELKRLLTKYGDGK